MKNFILTIMAVLTMANSAFAMSPNIDPVDGWRDYANITPPNLVINDETIHVAADVISDWDYFWGTTMNPANTGWNDFWFQCEDPNKNVGDCVGTIFAGVGMAWAATAVVSVMVIGVIVSLPTAGTVIGPVAVISAPGAMEVWI